MRGKSVTALQTQLQQRGFVIHDPQAVFGPSTRDAVKAVQKQLSLPATGLVDVDFWQALGGFRSPLPEKEEANRVSKVCHPAEQKLELLIQLLISKGLIEEGELDKLLKTVESEPKQPLFL